MTIRLAAVLCLALVPNLAAAAPAKAVSNDDADAAAQRTGANGTKQFIYDDEEIGGESLHPDHEPVVQRRPGGHPSLITLRTHFIPQMLKMATDV